MSKQDGMSRAWQHANPYWRQCMMESARAVAQRKPYLDTDDIVAWCKENHPDASTHEYRAIGPLMRACAKLGYFIQTQDWVESTQKQCNKRPMRVWYSLLYKRPHVKPRRHRINDPRQYTLHFGD